MKLPSDDAPRRAKLFDIYNANLAIFEPDRAGWFKCPICFKYFTKDDPLGATLGHVWPHAAGGELETLECKDCNSDIGAVFDSHVSMDSKRFSAFGPKGALQKDESGKALITIDGEGPFVVPVDAWRDRETKKLRFHANKAALKSAHRTLRNAVTPAEGKAPPNVTSFEYLGGSTNKPHLAMGYLHIAYLTAFRMFGYEYVNHADHKWLRDILLSQSVPTDLPLPDLLSPLDQFTELTDDHIGNVIGFARCDGSGAKTFAVPLYFGAPSVKFRLVLLPGFGERGAADYQKAVTYQGQQRANVIKWFYDTEPEDALISEKSPTRLRDIWASVFAD